MRTPVSKPARKIPAPTKSVSSIEKNKTLVCGASFQSSSARFSNHQLRQRNLRQWIFGNVRRLCSANYIFRGQFCQHTDVRSYRCERGHIPTSELGVVDSYERN